MGSKKLLKEPDKKKEKKRQKQTRAYWHLV